MSRIVRPAIPTASLEAHQQRQCPLPFVCAPVSRQARCASRGRATDERLRRRQLPAREVSHTRN